MEADDAIYNELLINNKCIVKMFCGTGKSLLMRKCKYLENKKLVVFFGMQKKVSAFFGPNGDFFRFLEGKKTKKRVKKMADWPKKGRKSPRNSFLGQFSTP